MTSHNVSSFSTTSLYYGLDDQSEILAEVKMKSMRFIDLYHFKNDHDATMAVKALDLDILVDITSHTYNGRIAIAALKPAPLVINYLGWPGTTGCDGFDYSMGMSHKVVYYSLLPMYHNYAFPSTGS